MHIERVTSSDGSKRLIHRDTVSSETVIMRAFHVVGGSWVIDLLSAPHRCTLDKYDLNWIAAPTGKEL